MMMTEGDVIERIVTVAAINDPDFVLAREMKAGQKGG